MHPKFDLEPGSITHEEQYEAAGWVAAVNVLKDVAEQKKREELDPEMCRWIGDRTLRLGQICCNDPANFVPVLERWRNKKIAEGEIELKPQMKIPRYFQQNNAINTSLQAAHMLALSRDPIDRELARDCDFQRFEETLYICHEFNMNTVSQHWQRQHSQEFAGALLQVQRDSSFYVGLYDR
jgi:hypothetical protein